MSFISLAFYAVADADDAALRSGDRTLDKEYVSRRVYSDDFEILDRNLFMTVLSCEMFVLEYSRRRTVRAHRADFSVYRAYAVRFFKSVLIPAFDNARKSVTFGDTHYIDFIARGESFDRNDFSYTVFGCIFEPEFFEILVRFKTRLLELSEFGFVEFFFGKLFL